MKAVPLRRVPIDTLKMACTVMALMLLPGGAWGQKQASSPPSLENSLTKPLIVAEGSDALLTCVAKNLAGHTLIWKMGTSTILTAGSTRITTDPRFDVIHDEGGDVYVLSIKSVSDADSGLYICEVNTDPPTRSFHKLTILSSKLIAPKVDSLSAAPSDVALNLWGFSTPSPISHDFTQCCIQEAVDHKCLGFCNVKNILEATTGANPSSCEPHFSKIVHCMADGKDHMPCCMAANVPDVCQDMCQGQYTIQTDDARTQLSCAAYTAPTLACIAAGINILPGRPIELTATNITDQAFVLGWSLSAADGTNVAPVDSFLVNVTLLRTLKAPQDAAGDDESQWSSATSAPNGNLTAVYSVAGSERTFLVAGLSAFSHYKVTITSENRNGRSLPSYAVKVLTKSLREAQQPGLRAEPAASAPPTLPDIRTCCINSNVTHENCLNTFCDPLTAKSATVPDLMICAPWGSNMFSCLADGKDHSACCDRAAIPDVCMPLCSGQISKINFRHFRCMEFMVPLMNCVLSGYGVLPSEPDNFRFSNIGANIGLLHWSPPADLADSVSSYRVSYLRIAADERSALHTVSNIKDTVYVLEDLQPNSSYEVFVEAVNAHGVGAPSSRIVFRTSNSSEPASALSEGASSLEQCCLSAGVKSDCAPLCRFNVSLDAIGRLSGVCHDDMALVSKCMSAGRNHLPCCQRRGVSVQCQSLCQGSQASWSGSMFTECQSYIGNMLLCFEDGLNSLPAPVTLFHAELIDDDRISLAWQQNAQEDQVTHYEIYYKRLLNNSNTDNAFDYDTSINVTSPPVTIKGLQSGFKYRFFVAARNSAGTSLPSSVIVANISRAGWDGQRVHGVSSPPTAIEITNVGIDSISLVWAPPAISLPDSRYRYRLYYGLAHGSQKALAMVETTAATIQLKNLKSNEQYIMYMSVITEPGEKESEPSETLLAWTESVSGAVAEAPIIHPVEGVVEGDSITVICVAMGSPVPTVTMYLGGHPIRSEKTHQLLTTIHNVTKDMRQVDCYADNGFGTPMQTSRMIAIQHKPYIKAPASGSVVRQRGQDVRVRCAIDAVPVATMSLGRVNGLLTKSDNIRISTELPGDNADHMYAIQLAIDNIQESDAGNYYCKANNTHGEAIVHFELVVSTDSSPSAAADTHHGQIDMLSCCQKHNVTEKCLAICSLQQLDLDFLLYSPECIPELEKFMTCGSDGSDHRHCCKQSGVPGSCLNWCKGQAVEETEACALAFAPHIAKCFHEGQFALPGPPQDVQVKPTDGHSVLVTWQPPTKNPSSVELYRILWRKEGAKLAKKIDTSLTTATLENLVPGIAYELVIKAGNANGTSQLTPALKFVTADKYIIETKVYSEVPSIVGVLVAVVLLVLLVAGLIYCVKGRKASIQNLFLNGARSFENPFFNQEVTLSQLQSATESPNPISEAACEVQQPAASNDQSASTANRSGVWNRLGLAKAGQFGFQRFS